MKQSKHRRAMCVPASEQVECDFGEDSSRETSGLGLGQAAADVVFKSPDPRSIFIGNQRLDRFLQQTGQIEVLVMGELLSSLDCWKKFESAYRPYGRAPYHPRLMMGLILLGISSGQTSLRQLQKLAQVDIRAWWLTGGLIPDYSTISKFITRHAEQLTETFFEDLTREVLKRTGSQGAVLAGDGTVIQAAASSLKLLKQEAAENAAVKAQQRAAAEPENDDLHRKACQALEVAETCRQRSKERRSKGRTNTDAPVSPTEPEAVVQPLKNKANRASYKPSIVSNSDRIITGQGVDPTNEPRMVEAMLKQTERITGQPVAELQLDSGYFCAAILTLCYTQDINLLCAPGGHPSKRKKKQDPIKRFRLSDFVYDEQLDQYRCPAGHSLHPSRRWKGNAKNPPKVLYSGAPCADCELRSRCKKGKGKRTITRSAHAELTEAQLAVMAQKGAQQQYRKRKAMVEPVFGELRYVQHLQRFRRRGMNAVSLEFVLHCCAHNIRRYLKLKRGDVPSHATERSLGRLYVTVQLQITILCYRSHAS